MGWRTYLYSPFSNNIAFSVGVGNGDRFLLSCKTASNERISPIIANDKPIILKKEKTPKTNQNLLCNN